MVIFILSIKLFYPWKHLYLIIRYSIFGTRPLCMCGCVYTSVVCVSVCAYESFLCHSTWYSVPSWLFLGNAGGQLRSGVFRLIASCQWNNVVNLIMGMEASLLKTDEKGNIIIFKPINWLNFRWCKRFFRSNVIYVIEWKCTLGDKHLLLLSSLRFFLLHYNLLLLFF